MTVPCETAQAARDFLLNLEVQVGLTRKSERRGKGDREGEELRR